MQVDSLKQYMRRGIVVIIALAVLTAVEYVVAVGIDTGRFGILAVIAIVKTWLIVEYFMHLSKVWHVGE
ncbi:MAG: cytochrome C oxidase subunit IV family protein [SAR202 cluster bacterium]|jgi:cytochrome c oxidase subunit IV|nr:cytochrome C oxidase subunit IV family protein [SAR202 cluster bacterium]